MIRLDDSFAGYLSDSVFAGYLSFATEFLQQNTDAEHQGIYLVLWFGRDTAIAGKRNRSVLSPSQLRQRIATVIPDELYGLIDVFVLDLSLSHGC